MTSAAKQRRVRRKSGRQKPLGDVRWGQGGIIEMIILNPWRDSPIAPTIFVNGIGGIQRLPDGLIRCTFTQDTILANGNYITIAGGHLIWPEGRWLDAGQAFKWIMQEFQAGTFASDGGQARRMKMQ